MPSERQHINLVLDAHRVALNVERDKEEFYRKAADLLNQRYTHYLRTHEAASAEQLWVYVALDVAVNLCSDMREKSLEPVAAQLGELNEQLLAILNESKPEQETH